MKLTSKQETVLRALGSEGALTADEFVTRRGWYVNSWAPVFTGLRKAGLVFRTGEQRSTSHGSKAFAVDLTPAGRSLIGV